MMIAKDQLDAMAEAAVQAVLRHVPIVDSLVQRELWEEMREVLDAEFETIDEGEVTDKIYKSNEVADMVRGTLEILQSAVENTVPNSFGEDWEYTYSDVEYLGMVSNLKVALGLLTPF